MTVGKNQQHFLGSRGKISHERGMVLELRKEIMAYTMNLPPEMKKKYIDRRAKDAVELGQALAAKNAEPFQRVGHQLKGNAVTFGYPELSDLGREMEEAAIRHDFASLQGLLAALEAWQKKQPA